MSCHGPEWDEALAAVEQRHAENPPPPLTPEQQHVIREAFRAERPAPKPSDDDTSE